jgi:hypothetical protein
MLICWQALPLLQQSSKRRGGDTLKVVGNCVVPALNVFQLPYQM